MTVSLEDAVFGTAAGVPFVALPPAGIEGRAPMVAVWHPLGPAGSPAEMAAAVPLRGLPAWRVYLGLPRTGERAVAPAPDADFVIDRYTPIVDRAAAEFPAAWAVLRERFPVGDGPVAVVGASAGGHAALTVLIRADVPVAAAALINPAVRTESVVAVNERYDGFTYRWTAEARAAAGQSALVYPLPRSVWCSSTSTSRRGRTSWAGNSSGPSMLTRACHASSGSLATSDRNAAADAAMSASCSAADRPAPASMSSSRACLLG